MTIVALQVLQKLEKSNDEAEIIELSHVLLSCMGTDDEVIRGSVRQRLIPLIRRLTSKAVSGSNTEYAFSVDLYEDSDNLQKVAVSLALLQDYSTAKEEMYATVLGELVFEIRKRNLDLIVNDISVNYFQWRGEEQE